MPELTHMVKWPGCVTYWEAEAEGSLVTLGYLARLGLPGRTLTQENKGCAAKLKRSGSALGADQEGSQYREVAYLLEHVGLHLHTSGGSAAERL